MEESECGGVEECGAPPPHKQFVCAEKRPTPKIRRSVLFNIMYKTLVRRKRQIRKRFRGRQ